MPFLPTHGFAMYRKFEDMVGGPAPDEEATEPVSLNDDSALGDNIEIIDDEDGGVTVIEHEPDTGALPIPDHLPFDANLADYITQEELNRIGADVKEKVTRDIESNREWRETFNNGLKFLGFKPEDRDIIFKGASGAWDSKLLEALIRFHAEIFAELFPSEGPAQVKIIGEETPDSIAQADRTKAWTNFYLTRQAKEYYDDSDQMLNYVLLAGSAFRKVYICPILRRPVAKYLTPNDVAMSYNASSIYDTPRFTHITDISKRDLSILQLSGFYRDVDLPCGSDTDREESEAEVDDAAGMDKPEASDDEEYDIYETLIDYDLYGFEHTDENGDETGIPLPYKITLDSVGGEILRIEKNWKQKKAEIEGVYERALNISHWKFMPGFGPFGIGLIHVLGGPVEMRTKLKRMLHDSGVFSNFPPTIRVKGMRMEHNTQGLKPGENAEIDTGGQPINNAIQQMTVKEPSLMLKNLYDDEGSGADRMIGNMDIAVGDGRQDAPVGTTIALLQAAKKPQTGVMRRLHRALTHELELFAALFSVWLPALPYPFPVAGGQMAIMKTDFNERIDVTPVSDPNVMSQTERLLRAESIMRISKELPPNAAPYQIEAVRRMYAQMKVDNINKLLPPPPQEMQPKDPITENMDAMNNQPLKAFITQNHDAHLATHAPFEESLPSMQAHIGEHRAMKYRLMMENLLGFQLPQPGAPVDPRVQEQVAMLSAKATEQYMAQQQAKNPPPPSVEQIMMADVQQKREKEQMRHADALAKLDAEQKLQAQRSDDAAAQRSSAIEIAKLKTAAMVAVEDNKVKVATAAPPGSTVQEKVAHIGAAAQIESARIKAKADDGKEAYSHERDRE